MSFKIRQGISSVMLVIVLLGALAACSTAQTPEPTAAATQAPSAAPATATMLPPTATLEPSPTPVPPTATLPPTSTPVPEQFTAWCVPADTGIPPAASDQPWVMPTEGMRTVEVVDGANQLVTHNVSCTFVYTFAQALPAGSMLKVEDDFNNTWLESELTPAGDNANTVYAVLNHSYIVDPPLWTITYRFVVTAPDGSEKRSDSIVFDKGWRPEACWNGALPNPVTLKCIKWEDLHPWDIGYKTVFPTPDDHDE
ncbi:MAG: hypothetical protein GYA17_16295 [Chloroflexi bacterium]|nr:hypothetical protein [Anaerolineaceae bacterium]NMB89919.1 hypothetical protein [Chloroflexota bacterium]